MRTLQRRQWTMILAATCLALAAGAAAAAPNGVATLSASASGVEFRAAVEHEKLVLTVSGPGGLSFRREFAAGEPAVFGAFDRRGQSLPNGNYTYELLAVPRFAPDVRQKLAAARKSGNERAAIAELRRAGKLPLGSVQSGGFVMESGTFIVAGLDEEGTGPKAAKEALRPAVEADQVIPDDLIVQGSGCFGFDCVNNESFGFDTIRLKENNLRIKFEDTSVGTFPTNDWQLTANDSASGGSSKFSIEDITGAKVPFTVIAGAATNSIFVDSTGRVGFRTSTPVLDLHINTSNTPALRLEQNSSGGFTAQTWDVAGNEANFFVRDVTSGSRLPFRIRPGAPTSSVDISADGDVGIGTASPDEKLHVFANEDANTFLLVQNTNAGTTAAALLRAASDTAQVNFQSHAAARTISRFGKTLGGWGEMLLPAGNGLAIGTVGAVPLVLGTNSANRVEIGGSGGVTVTGNFTVTGGTKNFAVVDPADSRRAIYYAALEGPEAGTYYRGTAKTSGGEAVIELPGYFTRITEAERMTVQLTPLGSWGQLFIAEKTPQRLVVRVATGTSDLEFDYFVQGVRKGYLGFEVERENTLPR